MNDAAFYQPTRVEELSIRSSNDVCRGDHVKAPGLHQKVRLCLWRRMTEWESSAGRRGAVGTLCGVSFSP